MMQFRAYAMNGVGSGAYSAPLTVQADKVPQFMNAPIVNYLGNHINPKWIFVTWQGIQGDA